MPRFNVSKLMDKWGVEENTIVSEGAKYKTPARCSPPPQPHETQYLQGIADSMFTRFQGRGEIRPRDAIEEGRTRCEGRCGWSGVHPRSMRNRRGLVDQIGYLGDAIAHARTIGGNLKNPTVFRYSRPPSLIDLFGSKSNITGGRASGGTTVNGINVNLDRNSLTN